MSSDDRRLDRPTRRTEGSEVNLSVLPTIVEGAPRECPTSEIDHIHQLRIDAVVLAYVVAHQAITMG
ncbi:hypothetical protein BRC86_00105 [Halobacteriales archaeon QS_3_64_16]|nr:MAG: hypothetical protein BRC86_00105 [Halobacteriales archaeon QS_3_64_16]